MAVDGKVSEPFGPTVQAWSATASPGNRKAPLVSVPSAGSGAARYRCAELSVIASRRVGNHGSSALLRLPGCHAGSLLQLVPASGFTMTPCSSRALVPWQWANELASVGVRLGVSLHLVWIRGNERYRSE